MLYARSKMQDYVQLLPNWYKRQQAPGAGTDRDPLSPGTWGRPRIIACTKHEIAMVGKSSCGVHLAGKPMQSAVE